ncbi:hypothetical protein GCM10007941_10100 [Amphritea balenae]|nr:hypothetical protein GCM10007941_10100 [Amphritea balenae]
MGKAAPHILQRDFSAQRPNEKWVTDVTKFNIKGQKIYLSPIIDLFNQEGVTFKTARIFGYRYARRGGNGLDESKCPFFIVIKGGNIGTLLRKRFCLTKTLYRAYREKVIVWIMQSQKDFSQYSKQRFIISMGSIILMIR